MKLIKTELGELPTIGSGEDPRTDGLHLSEVIKSIMQVSGMEQSEPGWAKGNTFAAGWIWEEVLSKLLADKFAPRVGEVEVDGILMTPDGLSLHDWTLEEYKFTWRSSKHNPLDNWYWITQIKGYMKGLKTLLCRLRVYHVMGDYKGSGPLWLTHTLQATREEVEENWQMILNHAEWIRSKDGRFN